MKKTAAKWAYGKEIDFKKPSRKVNSVWLHCSASDHDHHDDVSVMRDWHVNKRKWSDVGYHFFITKNGNVQQGRSIERTPAAQENYNTGAIAICCHGLKKEKFTCEQMESVVSLCKAILGEYSEKIRIRGHREVSSKTCPVYDYKKVLSLDEQGYMTSFTPAPTPSPVTPLPVLDVKKPHVARRITPIKLFDRGPEVRALQEILCQHRYQCDKDGVFGKQTELKLTQYQANNCLCQDGVAGRKTVISMFSSPNLVMSTTSRSKNLDIRVLQLLLSMFGRKLIHDGIFGSGTRRALMSVQRELNLRVDGVFGPKTLRAIR